MINKSFVTEADLTSDDPYRLGRDLTFAAADGDLPQVTLLLSRGADVNEKIEFDRTALMLASSRGSIDIANLLLNKGARINEQDRNLETALICAVAEGHTGVVLLLLEHGADIYIRNGNGLTAADIAEEKGHTPIIELLANVLEKDIHASLKRPAPAPKPFKFPGIR